MFFIIIVIALSIFSIREGCLKKLPNIIFYVVWSVLTLALVFRYGQGTDYYAYFMQYEWLDANGSYFSNALYHGEIGWYVLMLASKKFGFSFFVFLGAISFVMMLSLFRSIKEYSPYPVISMLILFPTFYMTYCYSAIRQGFVMCLFLGFGLPLLCKGKFVKFYILVVFLTILHTSAIVLIVIPFFLKWKGNKLGFFIIGIISLIVAFIVFTEADAIEKAESYNTQGKFSFLGFLVRVVMLYIVYNLYKASKKKNYQTSQIEDIFYKIYIVGFILFLVFVGSATLSQRISVPFKAVEAYLIPLLIYRNVSRLRLARRSVFFTNTGICFIVVVMIMNVELVKNIYSYLGQGNYREWVTPLDYPYISVFNQDEIKTYITHFDEEL